MSLWLPILPKCRNGGVSEILCDWILGKFILPKRADGKDMIPLDSETRRFSARIRRNAAMIWFF